MDKKQPEAQERKFWKRLCALNRFSFFYMGGGVARASDKSGNWIEVHSAQEIVDDAECEVSTQHARITELESQLAQRFDAADMATASAQGFRDGVAKDQQAMWRHIETAPKDGQAILVTDGWDCYCVEWDEEFDWWTVDDNKLGPFRLRGSAPTHWMPLPAAPGPADGESK